MGSTSSPLHTHGHSCHLRKHRQVSSTSFPVMYRQVSSVNCVVMMTRIELSKWKIFFLILLISFFPFFFSCTVNWWSRLVFHQTDNYTYFFSLALTLFLHNNQKVKRLGELNPPVYVHGQPMRYPIFTSDSEDLSVKTGMGTTKFEQKHVSYKDMRKRSSFIVWPTHDMTEEIRGFPSCCLFSSEYYTSSCVVNLLYTTRTVWY
jgi:hypothetical protein